MEISNRNCISQQDVKMQEDIPNKMFCSDKIKGNNTNRNEKCPVTLNK